MELVLLRYLHFNCIFIDWVIGLDISKWHCEDLTLAFQSDIVRIWPWHFKVTLWGFDLDISKWHREDLTLAFQSDIVRIWPWHFKVTLWGFDLDISKWHREDLSSNQSITLLLQSERLNKLRFTPLPTTVYLSHLPRCTPSHNLSSNRFPKCIWNKGCFILFKRDWKKNNKKQFPSIEKVIPSTICL